MKITTIASLTFSGIDIKDVQVQVQISPGIPAFTIVGLADKTIAESKERVKAALNSIGLSLPAKKILINLSPADLVKEGSHFDLAIAAALLVDMNVLPEDELIEYLILGELSLDGSILSVTGALPAAVGAIARSLGIIVPKANGNEAAWSGNEKIIATSSLLELINHFKGNHLIPLPELKISHTKTNYPDLKDVKGQETAKRALEIVAAGGHSLLMFGPPGTGKTLLASRLPGILPEMSSEEILEVSMISSISGGLKDGYLCSQRPFRAPHHSCSSAAMVGGGIGRRVKPGEISLAHNGILFLDELPEFPSSVIESLRQPIESGEVSIARSGAHIKYPANFQLIAAMNPCKCGYLSDPIRACSKAPKCAADYVKKISGPIMDRFDIHIEIAAESYDYSNINNGESSKDIANRVLAARNVQAARYEGYGIKTNNRLQGQQLVDYAIPADSEGKTTLNNAANKFRLSMRGYNKILKVARTIADLACSKNVYNIHITEALFYRQLDNQYYQ